MMGKIAVASQSSDDVSIAVEVLMSTFFNWHIANDVKKQLRDSIPFIIQHSKKCRILNLETTSILEDAFYTVISMRTGSKQMVAGL
jgi:hypothetical protein